MSSVPGGKRCSKCGESLPATEFYVKDRKKGRLYSWCKKCHCRKTAANYEADLERNREYRKQAARRRFAADPEKVREIGRAYKERNREALRRRDRERAAAPEHKAKKAAYRAARAKERSAYNKARYAANRERIKEVQRAYYERLGKEELARRHKAWREANPERLKAARQRTRKKRYPKHLIEQQLRRTLGTQEGAITPAEWEAIKAAADYRCLRCGKREPEIVLTMDHVLPVTAGGKTTAENIQGLCRPCNSKKGRRVIDYRKPR